MRYQLLRDYYLVQLDEIWESSKTKSGIITSNTAIQNNVEEVDERGVFKRRYGTVIEVPASLSDNELDLIDPGSPQPRRFVGHEWIQHQNRLGQRGYRDHENPAKRYYPSTFEAYETTKFSDLAGLLDVKVGDRVYFDHKATDVERYMGRHGSGHLFSVGAHEILCRTKKSPVFRNHERYVRTEIFPQGGWVFVQINFETWADITTPSGVIMKVAPEALPLQGRVIAAQKKELEGKNVLFERDADAPITIDTMELTCMQQSDILATLKGETDVSKLKSQLSKEEQQLKKLQRQISKGGGFL